MQFVLWSVISTLPNDGRLLLARHPHLMKRKYRLRRNSDFLRVRNVGETYASPFLVLAFLRNNLPHSRFGFVVSRRLGKAAQRNKIKRRVREAARLRLSQIKPGFDLVFIVRQYGRSATYKELADSVEHLVKQAGLWIGPDENQK